MLSTSIPSGNPRLQGRHLLQGCFCPLPRLSHTAGFNAASSLLTVLDDLIHSHGLNAISMPMAPRCTAFSGINCISERPLRLHTSPSLLLGSFRLMVALVKPPRSSWSSHNLTAAHLDVIPNNSPCCSLLSASGTSQHLSQTVATSLPAACLALCQPVLFRSSHIASPSACGSHLPHLILSPSPASIPSTVLPPDYCTRLRSCSSVYPCSLFFLSFSSS